MLKRERKKRFIDSHQFPCPIYIRTKAITLLNIDMTVRIPIREMSLRSISYVKNILFVSESKTKKIVKCFDMKPEKKERKKNNDRQFKDQHHVYLINQAARKQNSTSYK